MNVPPDIPDKLFFRIGEVSRIAQVPPSVLRFWESEFARIRPKRTDAGQRLYRKADVQTILTIRHLLYDRKFTIKGAREYLKRPPEASPNAPIRPVLDEIYGELKAIRDLLDQEHKR
ncbi:MAG: MerR family transcriptional regulator [Desulfatitalea sp.]|nr:MerR family transcriptional regulator [Desulfatitalea sp.]NNK01342.1 MerR family transcriptional regulator [Desulfatitalea sp.]